MAEFDITSKVASKLDPHLFLALLDFIEQKSVRCLPLFLISPSCSYLLNPPKKIYQEKEILETKVELLKKTKLVDFHIEIYKRLHKIPESEEVPGLFLSLPSLSCDQHNLLTPKKYENVKPNQNSLLKERVC